MPMMEPEKLFRIWEAGLDRPPLARTVAMLRAAGGAGDSGDPAALPIGARDLELLALREQAFGRDLDGIASCPECSEAVEVHFRTDDIRLPASAASAALSLESGGYAVSFRLPSSADLLSIDFVGDAEQDGRRILERCVSEATLHGAPVATCALPEELQES
ncbi:MAG TPA: hypothetical protein VMD25_10935, partial [Acidobacteriaceae bacterium]|nr:hypothetical protein [Acidobacteriaceae bacterium]